MTREEYLTIRGKPNLNLYYEYYKDHFDESKHKPFLAPHEFVQYVQMWPPINHVYNMVVEHYDHKFIVITFKDKAGIVIKYI
jgi:hypothetical protein